MAQFCAALYIPCATPSFGKTRMSFLRMIFGWWHHATFGTLATIWFSGTYVGTDKFGNRYYGIRLLAPNIAQLQPRRKLK